ENFGAWNTFHVAWLALAGAALFLLFYLMKPKSRSNIGNKFIIGYILGAIAWYFVMAEKLSGHNYHQFPVAPLIIFFIAYLFVIVAFNFELLVTTLIRLKTINQYLKGILRYVPLIILVILLIGPSQRSANAMFDTQFRGVDVAGEFIKANSQPDERFFHSSHQSFGSIWHADRIGYRPPQNLSQLQWAEENLNVKWLFLYQWGLYGGISYIPALLQIPETSDYIQANYSLRQIGLERNADQWAPVYFLFQKGGSTNLSNLQAIIGNVQPQVIQYEYSYGEVDFGVINLG
ncbi:MAG: hypothetical protein KKG59_04515, partial [Nanoarchaeota archaeon]|nr:hypothetical protein [Nanoarchaeota archaeon]